MSEHPEESPIRRRFRKRYDVLVDAGRHVTLCGVPAAHMTREELYLALEVAMATARLHRGESKAWRQAHRRAVEKKR